MELYKDILVKLLSHSTVEVIFPKEDKDIATLVESTCYKALKRIQQIIEDDTMSDPECFMKIEEIIRTLEIVGCHDGFRHDF